MYASKIPKHELELECILWDTPALWRMVVVGEGRVITDDLGRPWTLAVAGQYHPILGADEEDGTKVCNFLVIFGK